MNAGARRTTSSARAHRARSSRRRDAETLRTALNSLEVLRLDQPSILPELSALVRQMLGADQVIAYAARRTDSLAHDLEFGQASGSPLPPAEVRRELEVLVRGGRPRWGFFDPVRPEPSQRNKALLVPTFQEVPALVASAQPPEQVRKLGLTEQALWRESMVEVAQIASRAFINLKIAGMSQMRVLVCEGESLLAWFGGFRDQPFGIREQRLLQRLTPALTRRLTLQRRLSFAGPRSLAFDAALEAVASAAFLLDGAGNVVHANAAGGEALLRDPEVRGTLKEGALHPERAPGFRFSRIAAPGCPEQHLAVRSALEADPGPHLSSFARRWALTPRQLEVLERIVIGESNRAIGDALGCSERTIEHHATQLMLKAEVESRAALVARFWRTVMGGR